jgi:hypothetical protein
MGEAETRKQNQATAATVAAQAADAGAAIMGGARGAIPAPQHRGIREATGLKSEHLAHDADHICGY